MGAVAQKRLVRRLDLERILQKVGPHPSPKAFLEQYTIPVDVASEMLFVAAYVNDDVLSKKIVDLGCGTGRLAIGAAFLGAAEVVGVDVDRSGIEMGRTYASKLGLKDRVSWLVGDISAVHGSFDTVLQNPPFGVQRRTVDMRFLATALRLASRIYSLHKSGAGNRAFIKRFIEAKGGRVTSIFQMKLIIPRMFEFHTKRTHEVYVDLYRIEVDGE